MFLTAIGGVFMALGLFCGSVLVLAPLGIAPWETGAALWILFPLFTAIGYAVIVAGAKTEHGRTMSVAVCGLLLLLATASGIGLVLNAAAVMKVTGSTEPLWYVLVIGGLFGFIGVAARGRDKDAAPAAH